MIKELQLRLLPEQAANEQSLITYVRREYGWDDVNAVRVLKRSIDARQRTVVVNVALRIFIDEEPDAPVCMPTDYRDVSDGQPAVVVGAGPGGLFAALRLIELGMRPIVIERGKDVRERKKDIALISREHRINPESNYCFGEGGAGAYSDGKLYTRSKKRGSVERISQLFCLHGASETILSDVHPHIGTDRLPRVIENIRKRIIDCGGEVHFEACMESLIISGDEVTGVNTRDGRSFIGPVILATGHSARDVYRYLAAQTKAIEAKGIAVGARLEHPQELIDQIRYHSKEGRGAYLPTAEYGFTAQSAGRGVYSFCMCPGGFVVPSACAPEQTAVNGMSPSTRNSRWANAGIVVEMRPEDVTGITGRRDVLAVMEFQEQLERESWLNGGMKQSAPAQIMTDFMRKRNSSLLPVSSYAPGLLASPLHFWLPEFITSRLRDGLGRFDKISRGFLTCEAVMIGVETRTSSPVRIIRDSETMQHAALKGLYPCGEGAGYAGGIVSAAIDGELCAEKLAARYVTTRR